MKTTACILIVITLISVISCNPPQETAKASVYPTTAKVDTVDEYFGEKVADPYRWLEDANSAETKAWVDAENKVTQSYLAQIPQREAIRQRLRFGLLL